jgi:nucleoside-diphosphate-sugar epimerase
MDVVTGGAGLLGYNLAAALKSRGRRVRVVDFREPSPLLEGVEFARADIRDAEAVARACEGAERIFHLAALMHVGRIKPKIVREVNIGGLDNVMAAAERAGVRRIVFASTIELYGVAPELPCREDSPKDPPPGYPAQKWESELKLIAFAQRTGIEAGFTRMPMIFGPGFYHQKIVLLFFEAVSRGLPVPVLDDGERLGKAVALCDAVRGLLLVGDRPEAVGEAFNICCDEIWTHREMIEEFIGRVGSRSRVFGVPSALLRAGFDALAGLGLSPVAPEHFHFTLHDCVYDISKAKSLLGYAPRKTTVEALAETYESYMAGSRKELRKAVANALLKS